MPSITIRGCNYCYRAAGHGPETIVFLHGVLMNHAQFDAQMEALAAEYRCIAIDWRGHGRSTVTRDGYEVDTDLVADGAAIIMALGGGRCHVVGSAPGSFVALGLAVQHPELIASIALIASAADREPWLLRVRLGLFAALARWVGLRPFLDQALADLFGARFRQEHRAQLETWRGYLGSLDQRGATRGLKAELRHTDLQAKIGQITAPTLVIHGTDDRVIGPERARRLASLIPHSQITLLPAVGHSPSIEAPDQVTRALTRFLRVVEVALDQRQQRASRT